MNIELSVSNVLKEKHSALMFNQLINNLSLEYHVINDRLIEVKLNDNTYLDDGFLEINIVKLLREVSNIFQTSVYCRELGLKCIPQRCSYTLYKLKCDDSGINILDSIISSDTLSKVWMHIKYKIKYDIIDNQLIEYDIMDASNLSGGYKDITECPLGIILKSSETLEDSDLYDSTYYLISACRLI